MLHQPPYGQSDSPVMTPASTGTVIGVLLAAGALTAVARLALRGGIGDSLRSGAAEVTWGLLLSGPTAFIAVLLTTSRTAIAAEAGQPAIYTEARQQGATSVLAWIAHDDRDGAIVMFTSLSIAIAVIIAITHALFAPPDVSAPAAVSPPEPDDASPTRGSGTNKKAADRFTGGG